MRYTRVAVGRVTFFRMLLASSFVVGVAAAQQGFVVQPWSKSAPARPSAVEPRRAMPASGLPPARAALPLPRAAEAAPPAPVSAEPAEKVKWTPPVVTMLVDPWAKPSQLATPPRPQWVPEDSEIIDPWANEPAAEPRVATSRPADAPRDTIF